MEVPALTEASTTMKTTRYLRLPLGLLLGFVITGCGGDTATESASSAAPTAPSAAPVAAAASAPVLAAGQAAAIDQGRYVNAASEPANWINYGGTWKEQRYSTLAEINDTNVSRLGLAWFAELGTMRGVEGTPLVIDGVLYNISAWSVTTAYNAATGEKLWEFDPKVSPDYSRITCCGTVSRGVAA
ncbi:MAG: hypothetical protein RLZZ227_809, partial [Pseudomonadota bacterium]